MKEVTDETLPELDGELYEALQDWFRNGGQDTLDDFYRLSPEDRLDVLDCLDEFSLYEEVSVGGKELSLTDYVRQVRAVHFRLPAFEQILNFYCEPLRRPAEQYKI